MKNNNTIPAVEKTLKIMEILCGADRPVSQSDLAEASGSSTSTCYRILQSLTNQGWVRKNQEGGYFPSTGFFALAGSGQNRLPSLESLQPVLNRLAAESGLTCKLSIRQFEEQVSVLRAESPNPFSVSGRVGGHFPVIEGTVGAALLAGETEEELVRLVGKCHAEIEEVRDPRMLLRRIAFLRKHGYILSEHANRWNIFAMSAPVREPAGMPVAAITLLGVREDFSDEKISVLSKQLLKAAKDAAETVK